MWHRLFRQTGDQLIIINQGGTLAGYTANFAFVKGSKYGIILMRNYSEGEPDIFKIPFELLVALNKIKELE
jgi:hypothetical protein